LDAFKAIDKLIDALDFFEKQKENAIFVPVVLEMD